MTIDAGYFFEGVGIPLGKFEFASRSLTRPVTPGMKRPAQQEPACWMRRGSFGSIASAEPGWTAFRARCRSIMYWDLTNKRSRPREFPSRFFKAVSDPNEAFAIR